MAPTRETLNGIEDFIRWCETEVPSQLPVAMNKMILALALINQGEARKMSFGPYDPTQQHPEEAWQMPVRRITENYYLGWKVRRAGPNAVQLYNDSREAYFIEFGINWLGAGRRVRRPIRKLSLMRTLRMAETSHLYNRIWTEIYIHKGKGHGFTQTVQSPGGRWVNMSDREIGSMIRGYDRSGKINFPVRRYRGRTQRWRGNVGGGGSYGGPNYGRRLP